MLKTAVCVALFALPSVADAQFYTQDELAHTKESATPDIRRVMDDDIIGNLPRAMRPQASNVSLAFPETGPGPLAFYADPAARVIHMPLQSIRFFDDVATLFAWVESKECDPGWIQAYLWALLREGRDLPSPLRAFAIDRDTAFADEYTFDVSGKIVSSGLQFVLAHEFGHLMLGHRGGLSGAESQAQEIAADDFALDHFARLGGLPMGVFWYFMAAWWQDPVDGAETASSHPVSPERISRLADRLRDDAMAFSHGERDPEREAELVGQIGAMVADLADLIDDDGMLTLLPMTFDTAYPASDMAQACPS